MIHLAFLNREDLPEVSYDLDENQSRFIYCCTGFRKIKERRQ
jgi:hypothetical protein